MSIINVGLGMNLGQEISVSVQKLSQRIFCDGNSGGIVRIFVRKIGDLQETGIGKLFFGAGEFDHPKIERRFQQEADS